MIQCSNDFRDEINKLFFILNHQHKTMMALEKLSKLEKKYTYNILKIAYRTLIQIIELLGLMVYFDMDFIIKNRSQWMIENHKQWLTTDKIMKNASSDATYVYFSTLAMPRYCHCLSFLRKRKSHSLLGE